MAINGSAQAPPPSHVRVAVTQAEPVWLDLDATVEKTCTLISEAAANGAQLISFPECWLPGYPAWIWSRPIDMPLATRYIQNSLRIPSPQITKICTTAATHKITVVLGFSQNVQGSLYIAQAIISADGEILTIRKKIKATHMERTIFGDSFGDCLSSVVDTGAAGRVGALSCWEHTQPLLKYHSLAQRPQIHVAAWPPLYAHGGEELFSMSREGAMSLSQTYAIESQSFVLHTTAVLSQAGIDKMSIPSDGPGVMNKPGGGSSAVFGPDGRLLSTFIPEKEEGIVYADLDLGIIAGAKAFLDVCGHYSRPDLLWLGVERGVRGRVHVKGDEYGEGNGKEGNVKVFDKEDAVAL